MKQPKKIKTTDKCLYPFLTKNGLVLCALSPKHAGAHEGFDDEQKLQIHDETSEDNF